MTTPLQQTSIPTPSAQIVSHDQNSLSESVRLSFKTLQEATQFIHDYTPAFTDFAVLKQSRWVKKPVVLISLKTSAGIPPTLVDITDQLTKIFADITIKKTALREARISDDRPIPEIGLVRSHESVIAPDVAYVYLKVRGYAQQFIAAHAGKFSEFATVKSMNRSNITVRIAPKPGCPEDIARITDALKKIYPGAKILDVATLVPTQKMRCKDRE